MQHIQFENMFESELLINVGVKAAISAGKEIMNVYGGSDFQITSKEDRTPLTIADRNAHHSIMSVLEQTGLPVLSEEGKHLDYEIRKAWDYFWLVDPLDGTKEFIKRNGEFAVNIALIKKNTPVAGIIYIPVTKTLFFGEVKTGAWKMEDVDEDLLFDFESATLSAQRLPHLETGRPFTVVVSRSHLTEDTIKYLDRLKEDYERIEFLMVGSSIKQCMIAEGKADHYPHFGPTMEWDTGAGHAIVQASKGSILQPDGRPLTYNKQDLMNPHFIVTCTRV
jgi:3'(2'), 5'-bisphosphate nucleotidase